MPPNQVRCLNNTKLVQCLTCAQTRFGHWGMGADCKGQYMRRCLGVNTRISKTCIGIPDRFPAQRSTRYAMPLHPFPLTLPCFSFLGKVCLPSLSRGCLWWRQKIRPAHERKLLLRGNFLSPSKHTASAFFVWFRPSPLDISRHTSCRSIPLPIPKELEGLTIPDQDLRAPKSSLYSLLSVLL